MTTAWDFTADSRLLIITPMAAIVGVISAFVAVVVEREHPTKLLGYLGRKGIAEAWEGLREEDQVREAGWITSQTRLLRRKVRRVLSDVP